MHTFCDKKGPKVLQKRRMEKFPRQLICNGLLNRLLTASGTVSKTHNVSQYVYNIAVVHQSKSKHFRLHTLCALNRHKYMHCPLRNKLIINPLGNNVHFVPIIRRISSATSLDEISLKDIRLQKYLNDVLEKFIKAQTKLMAGKIKTEEEKQQVNAIIKELKPLVMPLQEYCGKEQEIEDLKQMANEMGKDDPEIQDAAASEIAEIEKNMKELEKEVLFRLVPPDPTDDNDIILEVSAGVGGEEAFIFTSDLFQMYESFAAYNGWSFNVITEDHNDGGHGGLRKASASISGQDVHKVMKYEAGVHRVQRIPRTEKHGRVHTSTSTVAVMPQVNEIEVKLNPKDLKIDTFRSSGPGGQHVNTTDSAVRIKHIPTGIVAECQTDRSQIKNKASAMKILLSRIYQKKLDEQQAQEKQTRKMQVGSASRSEKVRTYNFKQDRITDHRLSENAYNMEAFLEGGEPLLEMTQRLRLEAWKEQVLEIIAAHEEKANKE